MQLHDEASGRRLAEIAQADGFTVSHSTINRLRRGEVGTVTQSTVDAIAYLAGIDSETVLAVATTQASAGPPPEVLAREYFRLDGEMLRIAFDYARSRGIDLSEARDELAEVQVMARQRKEGRPWTPPWEPLGDDYAPGDEPWTQRWWRTSAAAAYRRRIDERLHERLCPTGVPPDASTQAVESKEAGWHSLDQVNVSAAMARIDNLFKAPGPQGINRKIQRRG